MSYEVDVTGPTIEVDHERLNEAFLKRHDQTFMQYVNIDGHTGIGRWEAMDHGIGFYPADKYGPPSISIPCHWDYDHMVQTKEDIEEVAKELGVVIKASLSY
jgi:hypothetical protein